MKKNLGDQQCNRPDTCLDSIETNKHPSRHGGKRALEKAGGPHAMLSTVTKRQKWGRWREDSRAVRCMERRMGEPPGRGVRPPTAQPCDRAPSGASDVAVRPLTRMHGGPTRAGWELGRGAAMPSQRILEFCPGPGLSRWILATFD